MPPHFLALYHFVDASFEVISKLPRDSNLRLIQIKALNDERWHWHTDFQRLADSAWAEFRGSSEMQARVSRDEFDKLLAASEIHVNALANLGLSQDTEQTAIRFNPLIERHRFDIYAPFRKYAVSFEGINPHSQSDGQTPSAVVNAKTKDDDAEVEPQAINEVTPQRPAPIATTGAKPAISEPLVSDDPPPEPDGPRGGRWIWWDNKRHEVSAPGIFNLIAYMWDREEATHDKLQDAAPRIFVKFVRPHTYHTTSNKANAQLKQIGIPWELKSNSTSRMVTKHRLGN